MNIGMIGYGRMGRIIGEIVQKREHTLSTIIDPQSPEAHFSELCAEASADVFIDFTHPDTIMSTIEKACDCKKNIVVGTTGWTEKIDAVKKMVSKSGIGFLWASNFSPAVQMFFRVARRAAEISNTFSECDIAAWEAHHRHKADAPGGTALTLGNILLEENAQKTELLLDRPAGEIQDHQLHLATVRVGETPGTHAALFDFPDETIEIKCTSRNRAGFALGAVIAAEWIDGKKGFYDFSEVFDEMVSSRA